ncbi:MAG: hypothetical protein RBQ95_05560 [Paracholeplasma sp.]|nr:hypothetical protein [Paracholeplasma sp.]MDY3196310.1 hypothetical protein [Paracholeplasma sp.]
MSKVLKYKFEGHEGFLSITTIDEFYYALVVKDTDKVRHIQKENKIELTTSLKGLNFKELPVSYIDDETLTSKIYHKLAEEKNLYFKELTSGIGVIQIKINDLL